MSGSVLFQGSANPIEKTPVSVEGTHQPDALAAASGLWIESAGSAMLTQGDYSLKNQANWLLVMCQNGYFQLNTNDLKIRNRECCMIPAGTDNAILHIEQEARIIWMTIAGNLAGEFMTLMGALPHRAMKQGALPSQLKLGKHIVQAIVRIGSAREASSAQLQQLLWGLLASHSGQPVAMDAVLSHEISKVIDAMRKNQYKDSFTLNDMANLSRMPVETFRKRFVSEVGMPPQSYQLFCKMERAKTLLKDGLTVRQAGVEVGMEDPYHFSKTFKNIVGMSPSHYTKTTQQQ
ncbi:MAG: helix-turn-helix transcriptional regulator [Clostridiales bacterium]|jgi:AraC-like DNA-binding protein|nr:helix-turn-helix transcriptional regulator [Clostridiales bacterium]